MPDKHAEAIREQGRLATERVAWLRKMAERQQAAINNSQATLDATLKQIEAAEAQVDLLRGMYRDAVNGEGE